MFDFRHYFSKLAFRFLVKKTLSHWAFSSDKHNKQSESSPDIKYKSLRSGGDFFSFQTRKMHTWHARITVVKCKRNIIFCLFGFCFFSSLLSTNQCRVSRLLDLYAPNKLQIGARTHLIRAPCNCSFNNTALDCCSLSCYFFFFFFFYRSFWSLCKTDRTFKWKTTLTHLNRNEKLQQMKHDGAKTTNRNE